jgi:hypothetical protein
MWLFGTYNGASTIMCRAFDWKRFSISKLDVDVMKFIVVRAWGWKVLVWTKMITRFSCRSCRIAWDWTWKMLVRKESKFFLCNVVLIRITDKTIKLLQVQRLKLKVNRKSESILVVPRSELEFFLRPTVSRPVSLGIGLPLGPLTRFYLVLLLSFDNYVVLLSIFHIYSSRTISK